MCAHARTLLHTLYMTCRHSEVLSGMSAALSHSLRTRCSCTGLGALFFWAKVLSHLRFTPLTRTLLCSWGTPHSLKAQPTASSVRHPPVARQQPPPPSVESCSDDIIAPPRTPIPKRRGQLTRQNLKGCLKRTTRSNCNEAQWRENNNPNLHLQRWQRVPRISRNRARSYACMLSWCCYDVVLNEFISFAFWVGDISQHSYSILAVMVSTKHCDGVFKNAEVAMMWSSNLEFSIHFLSLFILWAFRKFHKVT